jgi:hypothetical protein
MPNSCLLSIPKFFLIGRPSLVLPVTEEDPLGPEYIHTHVYTLYLMENSVKSRKKPVLASLRP